MMTLDEAVNRVFVSPDTDRRTMDQLQEDQQLYADDLEANEVVRMISQNFLPEMFVQAFVKFGSPTAAIKCVFLNAIAWGVMIGIHMERNTYDPVEDRGCFGGEATNG